MLGSSYEDNHVATGFGLHLAIPVLRNKWREDVTVAEGKGILEEAMKILFYRDCRTINRVRRVPLSAQRTGGDSVADCHP